MESPTLEEHLEALLRCPPELLPKAIFHDVRNPVNSMVNAAVLLEEQVDKMGITDETIRSRSRIIRETANYLHVYFDAVLEYEKIRRGRDEPTHPDIKE
jgi:hypothetical protein